jgi:protein involved in polysaccharide export with SLBB domain
MGGGIPEYREVVDSEGCIEIPFVGFLTAAGRTPADVADGMRTAYAAAGLASNAEIRLTYVTHFDPPPARTNLVRIQDPRQPVSP